MRSLARHATRFEPPRRRRGDAILGRQCSLLDYQSNPFEVAEALQPETTRSEETKAASGRVARRRRPAGQAARAGKSRIDPADRLRMAFLVQRGMMASHSRLLDFRLRSAVHPGVATLAFPATLNLPRSGSRESTDAFFVQACLTPRELDSGKGNPRCCVPAQCLEHTP
jgi:hypothetical protein